MHSTKFQSIQKGSRIIDKIFWELLKILKNQANLTELQLAIYIGKRAKQLGAQGLAFPPIVAFGQNSSHIHHFARPHRIGQNNFLMLDYGVRVRGYCSDFTRTLFLGNPNRFHEKIYNLVLNSQLLALKKIKPGANTGTIDALSRDYLKKMRYGKYFTHGTGHGVGKKIHEWPSFKPKTNDPLPKNCVMTVEPGIYLPKKFGVRIEDMILVVDKPKVFSEIPKDFKQMVLAK